ncbi:hypothetical protein [Acanthopleuribacter pedis]|uniref:Uncharacterized protein n=1 Tax=Acanthopleuribacter pedis TaxID=442870 RepID=A0A8J7U6J4_9BACT|nr:hypothetical protein [Acanthopleuribacter pedis]MBO1321989.1 hypothetical protein [Acanthopleuribacter pedis]
MTLEKEFNITKQETIRLHDLKIIADFKYGKKSHLLCPADRIAIGQVEDSFFAIKYSYTGFFVDKCAAAGGSFRSEKFKEGEVFTIDVTTNLNHETEKGFKLIHFVYQEDYSPPLIHVSLFCLVLVILVLITSFFAWVSSRKKATKRSPSP